MRFKVTCSWTRRWRRARAFSKSKICWSRVASSPGPRWPPLFRPVKAGQVTPWTVASVPTDRTKSKINGQIKGDFQILASTSQPRATSIRSSGCSTPAASRKSSTWSTSSWSRRISTCTEICWRRIKTVNLRVHSGIRAKLTSFWTEIRRCSIGSSSTSVRTENRSRRTWAQRTKAYSRMSCGTGACSSNVLPSKRFTQKIQAINSYLEISLFRRSRLTQLPGWTNIKISGIGTQTKNNRGCTNMKINNCSHKIWQSRPVPSARWCWVRRPLLPSVVWPRRLASCR